MAPSKVRKSARPKNSGQHDELTCDKIVAALAKSSERIDQLIASTNADSSVTVQPPFSYKAPSRSDDEDYAPLFRQIDPATELSPDTAILVLMKGLLGTGLLGLPIAYKHAGLYLGLVLNLLIIMAEVYCMRQLVRAAHYLKTRTSRESLDYANVMRLAFEHGPLCMRPYARLIKLTVNTIIFVNVFGFCCVYIVFMAGSTKEVVDDWSDGRSPSLIGWMAIYLVPVGGVALSLPYTHQLLLVCLIRNLRNLRVFLLLGNLTYLIAIAITFVYIFTDLPSSRRLPAVGEPSNLPLFLGTVLFSFEGALLILPVENRVSNGQHFIAPNGVLNTACAFVTALYLAVGYFGYIKAGDDVQGAITLNLPNHWIFNLARLLLSISMLVNFAVNFYIPIERIDKWIRRKRMPRATKLKQDLTLVFVRVGAVCACFGVAALIPNLNLLMALFGSLAGATTCLIFPPLAHLCVMHARHQRLTWRNGTQHVALMILGFAAFVVGTYKAVYDIVDSL